VQSQYPVVEVCFVEPAERGRVDQEHRDKEQQDANTGRRQASDRPGPTVEFSRYGEGKAAEERSEQAQCEPAAGPASENKGHLFDWLDHVVSRR
jgi:hypothetical protein